MAIVELGTGGKNTNPEAAGASPVALETKLH